MVWYIRESLCSVDANSFERAGWNEKKMMSMTSKDLEDCAVPAGLGRP
jgi:hypothetical protein